MKKRKLIPPFIMLLAGAVTGIVMLLRHYDTRQMLLILLGVFIAFYIAGYLIETMLNVFDRQNTPPDEEGEVIEKEMSSEDGKEDGEEAETDKGGQEGKVMQS